AVVRAAIMGGLTLFAQQIGRRQSGLNALAAASFFMAIFNPQLPWDISFQLSLAATLGLVLYAEPLQQGFVKIAARYLPYKSAKRISQPVGEYILFTFAAQLTTFPITIYHFHRLSLTSFLANPIILPIQPPIMTIGGLAVILGLIWLPLGKLIAPIIWPFTLVTIRVVEFLGKYQGGVLAFKDVGLLSVILLFGVLFLWTFARDRFKNVGAILKPAVVLTILGVVAVLIWRSTFAAPDGRLHLTMLNVGNGETFLIQTPHGENVLINGGPSTSLLSDGLGRRLPPFQHDIDILIVASPEEEQIAALSRVLDRFAPLQVLWAGAPSPCREADYLRSTLTERKIPLTEAEPGHRLELGEDIYLTVLAASKQGAILSLEWKNFRTLLPFGVTKEIFEELRMGQNIGEVSVLMLANNGYAPSNPSQWITNLHPQLLLLGVVPDNRQGLPDRELLDRLGGYSLARTDQHGWIHISTDGENMWLTVEKDK
ncbi:MAG: ComEC/Rec2 family competence protein, partial [Chloroflexota bacterium]|nr:ComEC/Rec2 family competence protein [Chloroflexota bacterium]